MSRHLSTETFQMDLRSSPSQQNLEPSRSSSLESNNRCHDMDQQSNEMNNKSHKLDLYSIPVFLLEVVILIVLAYLAFYAHFQYQHEPLTSGFYCDDISFRQHRIENEFTMLFGHKKEELIFVFGILVVPIVLIIFIELVNSMFGSVKFRQIRALCTCCKLHSITRRSIRFSGAFALGLFIVMISCDILATTRGQLRPFFALECPAAYQACALSPSQSRDLSSILVAPPTGSLVPTSQPTIEMPANPPPSQPISATSIPNNSRSNSNAQLRSPASTTAVDSNQRIKRAVIANTLLIPERQWVDLSGQPLKGVCHFSPPSSASSNNPDGGVDSEEDDTVYRFNQLAMSWPSFPAAVFSYACLYVSCYLSFVGTARPFRMISSILVVVLLLLTTIFDVRLVRDHFNHWDDVAAGAFLALVVTVFVLMVYLNRFKDTHYYENQKLTRGRAYQSEVRAHVENYSFDKPNGSVANNNNMNGTTSNALQNIETAGSVSNNDLAMRYFQIPRANYRGRQNFRV